MRLLARLLADCKLAPKLADALATTSSTKGHPSSGSLQSIANALLAVQFRADSNPSLRSVAAMLASDVSWEEYTTRAGAAVNVRRSAVMGGVHPDAMGLHRENMDADDIDAG